MKICTLTIVKEMHEEPADVEITLYVNPEDGIKAYEAAVEKAKIEAREYEKPYEDDETITATPYRWWSICDMAGYYESIIIELHMKEVI